MKKSCTCWLESIVLSLRLPWPYRGTASQLLHVEIMMCLCCHFQSVTPTKLNVLMLSLLSVHDFDKAECVDVVTFRLRAWLWQSWMCWCWPCWCCHFQSMTSTKLTVLMLNVLMLSLSDSEHDCSKAEGVDVVTFRARSREQSKTSLRLSRGRSLLAAPARSPPSDGRIRCHRGCRVSVNFRLVENPCEVISFPAKAAPSFISTPTPPPPPILWSFPSYIAKCFVCSFSFSGNYASGLYFICVLMGVFALWRVISFLFCFYYYCLVRNCVWNASL